MKRSDCIHLHIALKDLSLNRPQLTKPSLLEAQFKKFSFEFVSFRGFLNSSIAWGEFRICLCFVALSDFPLDRFWSNTPIPQNTRKKWIVDCLKYKIRFTIKKNNENCWKVHIVFETRPWKLLMDLNKIGLLHSMKLIMSSDDMMCLRVW